MTEHSIPVGDFDKFPGSEYDYALDLAEEIYWGATHMNFTMYITWTLVDYPGRRNDWGYTSLMYTDKSGKYRPNKRFYALGHYSRFISEGWVLTATTGSTSAADASRVDPLVMSAWVNPERDRAVAVAVNRGASRFASVDGFLTDEVEVWVTTESTRSLELVGTYPVESGRVNVFIPARSIVSIVDKETI